MCDRKTGIYYNVHKRFVNAYHLCKPDSNSAGFYFLRRSIIVMDQPVSQAKTPQQIARSLHSLDELNVTLVFSYRIQIKY